MALIIRVSIKAIVLTIVPLIITILMIVLLIVLLISIIHIDKIVKKSILVVSKPIILILQYCSLY